MTARDSNGRRARRLDGRLIGFRLPDREAQDARERLRREEGPGATGEQLDAAGYVLEAALRA